MSDDDDQTVVRSDLSLRRRRRDDARRAEVLALVIGGTPYSDIAARLGVTCGEVTNIVSRALRERPVQGVDELRAVENVRLDTAQAAIWDDVMDGNLKAVETYLRLSQRRSRLNGMDAPLQIELSAHVRVEMQQALAELQEIVLGEVVREVTDEQSVGSS